LPPDRLQVRAAHHEGDVATLPPASLPPTRPPMAPAPDHGNLDVALPPDSVGDDPAGSDALRKMNCFDVHDICGVMNGGRRLAARRSTPPFLRRGLYPEPRPARACRTRRSRPAALSRTAMTSSARHSRPILSCRAAVVLAVNPRLSPRRLRRFPILQARDRGGDPADRRPARRAPRATDPKSGEITCTYRPRRGRAMSTSACTMATWPPGSEGTAARIRWPCRSSGATHS
jgi:hypothetical protein